MNSPQVTIGCSGFPVPATKYLREFALVEVSDTAIGIPGPALVRRWRREAPAEFVFTALAPKELSNSQFEWTPAAERALSEFLPVLRDLGAICAVLLSAPDAVSSDENHLAARAFLKSLVRATPVRIVWEAPHEWSIEAAVEVVKDLDVTLARDPRRHPPSTSDSFAYYRLNGPVGYKSRYEDSMLEQSAETICNTSASAVYVVLANIDMYSDAKRLAGLVETASRR
ncbi:MAG: DUF72 domain-containing protein [Deltaproteobacteria bacterium]|nr:DUF72 domain-containing protein [Deltaproteobacteria bacterium]